MIAAWRYFWRYFFEPSCINYFIISRLWRYICSLHPTKKQSGMFRLSFQPRVLTRISGFFFSCLFACNLLTSYQNWRHLKLSKRRYRPSASWFYLLNKAVTSVDICGLSKKYRQQVNGDTVIRNAKPNDRQYKLSDEKEFMSQPIPCREVTLRIIIYLSISWT